MLANDVIRNVEAWEIIIKDTEDIYSTRCTVTSANSVFYNLKKEERCTFPTQILIVIC